MLPHCAVDRDRMNQTNLTTVHPTHLYSSCPAVSNTSSRATSSSIMHCFLYESAGRRQPRVSGPAERHTFYSRIILVHEMRLNELNRQGRFANTCQGPSSSAFLSLLDCKRLTTAAYDDELVFTKESLPSQRVSARCSPLEAKAARVD